MKKVDLVSMYLVEDVKAVQVMVFTELKCIFYQMCLYLVKYVKEKDIIEKLLKLNIKERV